MYSFLHLLKAEQLKYRHSIWKLFFLLIPIVPCIIGTVNYRQNLEILKDGWFDLWTQHTLFYALFFFAPLIAIAASFLWRSEHKGKNWNLYLTTPVSVLSLYSAKCCILLRLILEMQLLVGVLFVLSGKLIGIPGSVPPVILWWLLRGTLGSLVIAAAQMLISMLIHNFAVPVLFGFLGGITGYLVTAYHLGEISLGTFFPYSQLMMGMNSNRSKDILVQGNVVFLSVIAVYCALFFILAIVYLKKCDARTQ